MAREVSNLMAGRAAATLGLAAVMALPGCLQRRIRVVTDPPGATVWLNDVEIGRSPAETGFTFFGEYDVRAAKDGYQTQNTTRKAVPPWYEYPFIDLIVVALPWKVETEIEWTVTLEPLAEGRDDAGLLERADEMRRQFGLDPPAEAPR